MVVFDEELSQAGQLAQLEYTLPRLTRMWVHLSRIRGGIGLRGPGESQLETDRRMIRQKMGVLKRKLAEVTEHREQVRSRTRQRRVLRVALVGYTNAGKSSLLKALTGAEAHVEDRLFATPGHGEPGGTPRRQSGALDRYGGLHPQASARPGGVVPEHAGGGGRRRRDPARSGRLASGLEQQADVVGETLEQAGLVGVRRVVVALNKADLLVTEDSEARLWAVRGRGWEAELASAVVGSGLASLVRRIAALGTGSGGEKL